LDDNAGSGRCVSSKHFLGVILYSRSQNRRTETQAELRFQNSEVESRSCDEQQSLTIECVLTACDCVVSCKMRNILERRGELPILQHDEYTQDETSGLRWNRRLTMCNKVSRESWLDLKMVRFVLRTIRRGLLELNHF
jgi:hypothetical protein